MRRLAIGLAAAAALLAWCAHPVCVPLSDASVAAAERWQPLAGRTERQLHGPVWQRRDGRWHQCKSWISRQLFF
jgi:hypothetical protein